MQTSMHAMNATKEITVFLTSNANATPGALGYTVHLSDPDAGYEGDRTLANGYGVPYRVTIPAHWDLAETAGGETYLWNNKTPLELHFVKLNGVMVATCPQWSRAAQIKDGSAIYLKASQMQ